MYISSEFYPLDEKYDDTPISIIQGFGDASEWGWRSGFLPPFRSTGALYMRYKFNYHEIWSFLKSIKTFISIPYTLCVMYKYI
jgi:hypothetical protein